MKQKRPKASSNYDKSHFAGTAKSKVWKETVLPYNFRRRQNQSSGWSQLYCLYVV